MVVVGLEKLLVFPLLSPNRLLEFRWSHFIVWKLEFYPWFVAQDSNENQHFLYKKERVLATLIYKITNFDLITVKTKSIDQKEFIIWINLSRRIPTSYTRDMRSLQMPEVPTPRWKGKQEGAGFLPISGNTPRTTTVSFGPTMYLIAQSRASRLPFPLFPSITTITFSPAADDCREIESTDDESIGNYSIVRWYQGIYFDINSEHYRFRCPGDGVIFLGISGLGRTVMNEGSKVFSCWFAQKMNIGVFRAFVFIAWENEVLQFHFSSFYFTF